MNALGENIATQTDVFGGLAQEIHDMHRDIAGPGDPKFQRRID